MLEVAREGGRREEREKEGSDRRGLDIKEMH
jgi:hypothetical protein